MINDWIAYQDEIHPNMQLRIVQSNLMLIHYYKQDMHRHKKKKMNRDIEENMMQIMFPFTSENNKQTLWSVNPVTVARQLW